MANETRDNPQGKSYNLILFIFIIYPAISGAQYYPFSYGADPWSYSSYPSWGWNSYGYSPLGNMFNQFSSYNPFSTFSYPNYFNPNSFSYPYENNSYSYPTWGNNFYNNSFGYPFLDYSESLYTFQSFMDQFSNPYSLYQHYYYLNPYTPRSFTEEGIFTPYPFAGPEWPNWGSVITPSGSLMIVGGPYS